MKGKALAKLSSRQIQVLPYLVSCPTYEEAARQAGISAKQIYVWLKEPLFEKELIRQKNEVFTNAIRLLKGASQKAVATLVACLDDANAKNRISAADKILSHALHGMELFELEERLAGVEKMVEDAIKEHPPSKRIK